MDRTARAATILLLLAATLAGCGGTPTPTSPAPQDLKACTEIGQLGSDIKAGIVTDAEVRDRLKTIHADAAAATKPVADGVTQALAMATADATPEILTALNDTAKACLASKG